MRKKRKIRILEHCPSVRAYVGLHVREVVDVLRPTWACHRLITTTDPRTRDVTLSHTEFAKRLNETSKRLLNV